MWPSPREGNSAKEVLLLHELEQLLELSPPHASDLVAGHAHGVGPSVKHRLEGRVDAILMSIH